MKRYKITQKNFSKIHLKTKFRLKEKIPGYFLGEVNPQPQEFNISQTILYKFNSVIRLFINLTTIMEELEKSFSDLNLQLFIYPE